MYKSTYQLQDSTASCLLQLAVLSWFRLHVPGPGPFLATNWLSDLSFREAFSRTSFLSNHGVHQGTHLERSLAHGAYIQVGGGGETYDK